MRISVHEVARRARSLTAISGLDSARRSRLITLISIDSIKVRPPKKKIYT